MRKAPIFTVNLRRNSVFFYLIIFCIFVIGTSLVSKSHIKSNLNPNIIKSIIFSNVAFSQKTDLLSTFFPLFSYSKKPIKDSLTIPNNSKKETVNPTSKTVGKNLSVKVSNSTPSAINTGVFMQNLPDFLKEDVEVLILHTHTSESYTPSEKYNYTPTDTYRTLDSNYNMVAVGKKVKSVLENNGIKVYHDTTINDYPSYNQSYNKSSVIAENYIKTNPKIKIILDIHRDAIEDSNGKVVKYVSAIEQKNNACLMMVVGSNLNGLSHDNWSNNMSFALLLQEHINSLYPTLMRPVNFRKQRFNQHLAPGAIIVEVGSNGNTLEEALLGAEHFASALSSFIKNGGR